MAVITAPFLTEYWPHLLALVAVYITAIFISKQKDQKDSAGLPEGKSRKKYVSPDIRKCKITHQRSYSKEKCNL